MDYLSSIPVVINASADTHAGEKVASDLRHRMILMRCGHYAMNGSVCDQELQTDHNTWMKDFLFHLTCSVCGKNVTNPMSAYIVDHFHGWNNWLDQEATEKDDNKTWIDKIWCEKLKCNQVPFKKYMRYVHFSDDT